ncbi:MAG: hypothetical protein JSW58_02465, partial [Candidatus Latescibacterota bacterium]
SPVLRDENHIYLARVVDRIPESVKPAADVDQSIRQTLIYETRKNLTHRRAKAFYMKAKTAGIDEAVETYQTPMQESETFHAVDNLDDFGPNSAVATAALSVEIGEICPPVECRGSYVVIHVVEKSAPDQTDYKARFATIRDRLEGQKIQAYVAYWYEELREQSQIEDYRGRVY